MPKVSALHWRDVGVCTSSLPFALSVTCWEAAVPLPLWVVVLAAQPHSSPKDLPRCMLTLGTSIKALTCSLEEKALTPQPFPRVHLLSLWNMQEIAAERSDARSKKMRERSSKTCMIIKWKSWDCWSNALFWLWLSTIVLSCHSKKHCYQWSRYSAACTMSTGSNPLFGREVPFT